MSWFQRFSLSAYIAVELLIFVGAFVRTTGSGLGCPDWPFCYGCWIPPASAQEIDFTKLDIEKFRRKAASLGRDPSEITLQKIKEEFDPVATWIEYFNRLTSLPVGLCVLSLWIASFGQWKAGKPILFLASTLAVLLVGINAWLGARVVLSGLKPGIITLHMALAILLQCLLVYVCWKGFPRPWALNWKHGSSSALTNVAWLLFGLVALEGVMGSQVRELTDELARTHMGLTRVEWIHKLESSWVYLIHRSFSWLILFSGFAFFWLAGRELKKRGWLEIVIFGIVLCQMCLGVILANVGILPFAQILHIGLSSLLVSGLFLWLLGSMKRNIPN